MTYDPLSTEQSNSFANFSSEALVSEKDFIKRLREQLSVTGVYNIPHRNLFLNQ
jgi:hypothetical protein